MKINSIEQVNFKSLYIKDERFNERERMLADDISRKLLGSFKLDDEKCRTWNEWLKKEKGIDIFVKRANDTQDMLTVFGLINVKDFDNELKGKDFFVVGNYHTTDFDPQDVLTADKNEKIAKTIGYVFPAALLAAICILGGLFCKSLIKNHEVNKEPSQKIYQMKDSIVDTLKMTKIK